MWNFDRISGDVGRELKVSAERIHRVGMRIEMVILILGMVGAAIAAIGEGEIVPFLIIGSGVVVEYLIGCGIISSVAMHRYAKGEQIHLLQQVAENTSPAQEAKPEAPAPVRVVKNNASFVYETPANQPAAEGWKCACGRTNASYVSSCTCGRTKWDNK